jgi:hypothetical protein
MKTSARRRSSLAIKGGLVATLDTTLTRTLRRWSADTSEQKAPSRELEAEHALDREVRRLGHALGDIKLATLRHVAEGATPS